MKLLQYLGSMKTKQINAYIETSAGAVHALVLYVDDILLISNDIGLLHKQAIFVYNFFT